MKTYEVKKPTVLNLNSWDETFNDLIWNNFYLPLIINTLKKDINISLKRYNGNYETTYESL